MKFTSLAHLTKLAEVADPKVTFPFRLQITSVQLPSHFGGLRPNQLAFEFISFLGATSTWKT
ncbi:MAG: hypothetical protein ACTS68_01180 [Candidatus Hodgkinia cicadicola]